VGAGVDVDVRERDVRGLDARLTRAVRERNGNQAQASAMDRGVPHLHGAVVHVHARAGVRDLDVANFDRLVAPAPDAEGCGDPFVPAVDQVEALEPFAPRGRTLGSDALVQKAADAHVAELQVVDSTCLELGARSSERDGRGVWPFGSIGRGDENVLEVNVGGVPPAAVPEATEVRRTSSALISVPCRLIACSPQRPRIRRSRTVNVALSAVRQPVASASITRSSSDTSDR